MKQSFTKDVLKSPRNSLCIEATKTVNQPNLCYESLNLRKAPNRLVSPNGATSNKIIENYRLLLEKNFNQTKKDRDSVDILKNTLTEQRNQRKSLLQQIQNQIKQKQNTGSGFDYTFTGGFKDAQQPEQPQDIFFESDYFTKLVISDSFLGSFRAAYSFYVQLYFQKMTLALEIKKKNALAFVYLVQFLDYKLFDMQSRVDIDDLCLAIFRLIKNKNAQYKLVDIKYGLKKCLPGKTHLSAKQFAPIFVTSQKETYLSNPSKHFSNMEFEELVKTFFQIFVQFYDTQIKFKKICKANQKKLMKLIVQLSINSEINLKTMAEFLYFDSQKYKKWLMLRFEQFFKDNFGNKDQAVLFLKWINE